MVSLIQIVILILLALGIVIGAAINLGKWIERQMQAAEFRRWQQKWNEEISPQIQLPASDWPQTGYAEQRFFGGNPHGDVFDIKAYMEQQDADARAFIEGLRLRGH